MLFASCVEQQTVVPGEWKIAAQLPAQNGRPHLGIAGPVAGIHNGVLLVGGGANFPDSMPWLGGKKKYHDELYAYRVNEEGLSLIDTVFQLPFNLAYSANCVTPKGIVVAGGENENGLNKTVLLLRWNDASNAVVFDTLPHLAEGVTNAAIATDGRNVYLAGGETGPNATSSFLKLDLENLDKGWQRLPSIPKPLSHAVLVNLAGKDGDRVYLIGGRKKNENGISDLYSSVYLFDSKRGSWQQANDLPYALSAGTGFASNNSIFLFGGDRGETFHKAETLIAAIAKETDAAKKEELNKEKVTVQSGHPGFSKAVLQYDVANDGWKELNEIPFTVPVTTTALFWNNRIYITSGEIRAGVRTPDILTATLK